MRTKLVAGNWKMNTTLAEAHTLARGVLHGVEHIERIETVLCPPFLWLTPLADDVAGKGSMPHLKLGAQNMYHEDSGAFTGEISPLMLKELVDYVILGHSERTHIFGEKTELVAKKVESAFAHGLTPILCVGEDTQNAQSARQVAHELGHLTKGLSPEQLDLLVVAYEPVWAIGTGHAATAEYAQTVMAALRSVVSEKTRILYGGSVNELNAQAFLQLEDCDGFLIGGTSLKLKPFLQVCQYADDLAATLGHTSLHPHPDAHKKY